MDTLNLSGITTFYLILFIHHLPSSIAEVDILKVSQCTIYITISKHSIGSRNVSSLIKKPDLLIKSVPVSYRYEYVDG